MWAVAGEASVEIRQATGHAVDHAGRASVAEGDSPSSALYSTVSRPNSPNPYRVAMSVTDVFSWSAFAKAAADQVHPTQQQEMFWTHAEMFVTALEGPHRCLDRL